MPQYLALAESVLERIKRDDLQINKMDRYDFLNLIISNVRELTQSTHLKMNQKICNAIFNFESKVIDLSLLPNNLEYEDEFLLWLAGFVEQITIDENRVDLPPLKTLIKDRDKVSKEVKELFTDNLKSAEEINQYFRQNKNQVAAQVN